LTLAQPSPKVAVVMPLAENRGGSEAMLLDLLRFGRDLGISWVVIFLEPGPMVDESRQMGIETHLIPGGRLRQPHRVLAAVWRIRRLIRSSGIRAVVSWISKAHLYGGPAAMLARVPSIWYQLAIPKKHRSIDGLATMIPARGVIACSSASATGQLRLWPRRPIRIVHPGVRLDRFDPAVLRDQRQVRAKLGLAADVPVVGIVGRLQTWKGQHLLVEAMPHILRTHPEAVCVIVGGEHQFEPDYSSFLRERIAALGLTDKVVMAGLQTNVPEWMQAMDVVVHASVAEPFGIVVIEAMALGKPVAATDTAGPTEIITHGKDGLLWHSGDVAGLAGAVLRYLDDPSYAADVGRAAAIRARDFSVDRYARGIVDSVNDLALGGSTPASRNGDMLHE
jgi:glycosyltransferase involved in cell wall biosynthesis